MSLVKNLVIENTSYPIRDANTYRSLSSTQAIHLDDDLAEAAGTTADGLYNDEEVQNGEIFTCDDGAIKQYEFYYETASIQRTASTSAPYNDIRDVCRVGDDVYGVPMHDTSKLYKSIDGGKTFTIYNTSRQSLSGCYNCKIVNDNETLYILSLSESGGANNYIYVDVCTGIGTIDETWERYSVMNVYSYSGGREISKGLQITILNNSIIVKNAVYGDGTAKKALKSDLSVWDDVSQGTSLNNWHPLYYVDGCLLCSWDYSPDEGETWQRTSSTDIADSARFVKDGKIYATYNNKLYSTNNGTWVEEGNITLNGSSINPTSVWAYDSLTSLIFAWNGSDTIISSKDGLEWETVSTTFETDDVRTIVPLDDLSFAVMYSDYLMESNEYAYGILDATPVRSLKVLSSTKLSDIAQAGDGITFTGNGSTVESFTTVGTVTITDGVAYPMNENNYVYSNELIVDTSKTWEYTTKVRFDSATTRNAIVCFYNNTISNSNVALNLLWDYESVPRGVMTLRVSSTGSGNWDIANTNGITAKQADKDYWLKIGFDGTKYYVKLSENGTNYNPEIEVPSSTAMLTFNRIALGSVYQLTYYDEYIDLIETSFKNDNNIVWTPYVIIPDTKIIISANTMTGATGSVAGTAGMAPAPSATDNTKFLRGDGTWAEAGGSSDSLKNLDTEKETELLTAGTYNGVEVANNTVFTSDEGKFKEFTKVQETGETSFSEFGDFPESGTFFASKVVDGDTTTYMAAKTGKCYISSTGTSWTAKAGLGQVWHAPLFKRLSANSTVWFVDGKYSTDGGNTWESYTGDSVQSFNTSTYGLAGDYFYVSYTSGGKYWLSSNGQNWSVHNFSGARYLVYDGTDYLLLSNYKIYKTKTPTDENSWEEVVDLSPLGIYATSLSYNNGKYYAGFQSMGDYNTRFFVSSSLTGTWTQFSRIFGNDSSYTYAKLYFVGDLVIVAVSNDNSMYQSADFGQTFTELTNGNYSSTVVGDELWYITSSKIYSLNPNPHWVYSLTDLSYDLSDVNTALSGKQDTLTAGTGIDITSGTISAIAMVGATGSVAGTAGMAPAPSATDNTKFLRGDGTWAEAGGGSSIGSLTDIAMPGNAIIFEQGGYSTEGSIDISDTGIASMEYGGGGTYIFKTFNTYIDTSKDFELKAKFNYKRCWPSSWISFTNINLNENNEANKECLLLEAQGSDDKLYLYASTDGENWDICEFNPGTNQESMPIDLVNGIIRFIKIKWIAPTTENSNIGKIEVYRSSDDNTYTKIIEVTTNDTLLEFNNITFCGNMNHYEDLYYDDGYQYYGDLYLADIYFKNDSINWKPLNSASKITIAADTYTKAEIDAKFAVINTLLGQV